MQSTHEQFEKHKSNKDIVILCDGIESPANIGSILRLADAFGVSKVYFSNGIQELTKRAKSVSRGTEKHVNFEFITKPQFDDRYWFCLELTTTSSPLSESPSNKQKLGIIVGNENSGVSDHYLNKFPSFHIKMFGNNSSMNVSNALSAALYEITRLT